MHFDPADMGGRDVYFLMTDVIAPRPIAFISSQSAEGALNLAPFSYFGGVTSRPALLSVCVGYRKVDGQLVPKDTARNVLDTGEFVVNVVDEALAEAMNVTAAEYPHGMSEFEVAGLTAAPSDLVAPPRVQESPVSLECTLYKHVDLGEALIHMLVGQIRRVHVRDDLVDEAGRVATDRLRPVGRLGVSGYTRAAADLFDMQRPIYKPAEQP